MAKLFVLIVLTAIVSAVLTKFLLPLLQRLKAGQTEREEGPEAHKAKNGTPTMGGIAFIIAITICAIAFGWNIKVLMMVAGMLLFGLIGFIDDYIKVIKKRNLGLTAKQKIALQTLFSAVIAVYAFIADGGGVFIPFFKVSINFGWLYIPFAMFVILAMSNSVNLTDGLDGLASSVTAVVALAFAIIGQLKGNEDMMQFTACVCGGCLGFLVFNHYPAKLFMGDTGSMALGGALAAAAIIGRYEFILVIAGFIYVAEALSVIIQVFVFKTQNGRRFFRMAPLHHHFELGGWKETKVVTVFTLVTVLLCVVSLLSV